MGYLFHKDIVNGWDSSYNKTENNSKGAYNGILAENIQWAWMPVLQNKMNSTDHVWKTELPVKRSNGFIKVWTGQNIYPFKEKYLGKQCI